MPPSVKVSPSLHCGLAYHLLSHLDLGRDAASLYRPRTHTPPWAKTLTEAYTEAPGRLGLQFAPLRVRDLIELFGWLASPPAELQGRANRRLCTHFYEVLEAETAAFEPTWTERHASAERAGQVREALEGLGELFDALWARRAQPTPQLIVRDAPALGKRGRGLKRGDHHLIATSLAEPIEHVLCQIIHEAIHPVSDAELDAKGAAGRDTREGSTGFERHQRLEVHAVSVGQGLIDSHAPMLKDAYRDWRDQVGLPP